MIKKDYTNSAMKPGKFDFVSGKISKIFELKSGA